jgi:hypothetical protein
MKYEIELDLGVDELSPREEYWLYTKIWNFCEEQCMDIHPPIRFNKVKEESVLEGKS